jgi:NTE family protein
MMTVHNEPINRLLVTSAGDLVDHGRELPDDGDDLLVGLAFSGGGMRAAAFSYGVLSEFDRIQLGPTKTPTRLIDRVDFLSGVSGGAITAAYFGLKGRAGLSEFHEHFSNAQCRGISLK